MKKTIYSLIIFCTFFAASYYSYQYGEFSLRHNATQAAKSELRDFRALNLRSVNGVEAWHLNAPLPQGAFVVTPLEKLTKDDIFLAIKPVLVGNLYVVIYGNGEIKDYEGKLSSAH